VLDRPVIHATVEFASQLPGRSPGTDRIAQTNPLSGASLDRCVAEV
jgi:hypothetical protein